MRSSRLRQQQNEQQRNELLASWRKKADDYRRETERGVREALDSRTPDRAFAAGWTRQREPNQSILDANVRDFEPKPKKRWWQS